MLNTEIKPADWLIEMETRNSNNSSFSSTNQSVALFSITVFMAVFSYLWFVQLTGYYIY